MNCLVCEGILLKTNKKNVFKCNKCRTEVKLTPPKSKPKKYTFTGEEIIHNGIVLKRILINGHIGGFIEHEGNLSQEGSCSVEDNAMVYGDAVVKDHAVVSGNAEVFENAIIKDYAEVSGNSKVYGNAKVCNRASIKLGSQVYDNAEVYNSAVLYGSIKVFKNAKVFGSSAIYDSAEISGNSLIESTFISGHSKIKGGAVMSCANMTRCMINGDIIIHNNHLYDFKFDNKDIKRLLPTEYKFKNAHVYYHPKYRFIAIKEKNRGWLIRTVQLRALLGKPTWDYKPEDLFKTAFMYLSEYRHISLYGEEDTFQNWVIDKLKRYDGYYQHSDYKDIHKLRVEYYAKYK